MVSTEYLEYTNHLSKLRGENLRLREVNADLLAACNALLHAGPCDLCYEDGCDPLYCECKCHEREGAAREQARAAIAKGTPEQEAS